MTKKKKTDFYLLKKNSLSEGDLFVTDYIKTKQRVKKLEDLIEVLKIQLDFCAENLKNEKKKVIKLFDEE